VGNSQLSKEWGPLKVFSVPLHALDSGEVIPGVPCLTSTFLEFLDENGRAFRVHELEPASTYTVVITTFGGLYRYNTEDRVVVTGGCNGVPCLEFRGRGDRTLDLCGEKVSEPFVLGFLQPRGLTDALVLADAHGGCYSLLVPDRVADDAREELAIEFESYLCSNPQYEYARRVGVITQHISETVASLTPFSATPKGSICGANRG
jgi:hypothetical protein